MLKAPFPWFGGKSRVAHLVWDRFGNTPNYVEPFAGSLAVLLGRPHEPRIETVNDLDCYVANFWRAMREAPSEVAEWADWPVNEADLTARHQWLVNREDFRERMKTDPDFFDAKIAGWWVWGLCQWIGGGWCDASKQLPHLGDAGQGVNRKRPHLGNAGQGVNRQLPHLGNAGRGPVEDWFLALADRLRKVRVCCGDWERVLGPTPTEKQGITGVFLDPPYCSEDRDACYSVESFTVAHDVRRWALENQDNSMLRIALCGYEGEHDMPGWDCVAWKASGGYGSRAASGNENCRRERIWFSPHCLPAIKQLGLWEAVEPVGCDSSKQGKLTDVV